MKYTFDECPSCKQPCNRLVIYEEPRKLGCDRCGTTRLSANVNLGQTVNAYTRRDGSKGRLTTGKSWEIGNRVLAEDGVTVINKVTGKETQF